MRKKHNGIRNSGGEIRYKMAYEEMLKKGQTHREHIAGSLRRLSRRRSYSTVLTAAGKRVAGIIDLVARKLGREK